MGLQAKHVTVRTKAESQSCDRVPTPVSIDLIENRGGNRVQFLISFLLSSILVSFLYAI